MPKTPEKKMPPKVVKKPSVAKELFKVPASRNPLKLKIKLPSVERHPTELLQAPTPTEQVTSVVLGT